MRITIFIINFVLMSCITYGQDTTKLIKGDRIAEKTKYNMIRIGCGIQRSFYSEIGYTRSIFISDGYDANVYNYYTAIEWTPTISKESYNVLGIKVGAEIVTTNGGAGGIELKYLSDFNKFDLVLTPKLGIGLLGVIGIYYGYNITVNKNQFSKIGHHQFSMMINFNKGLFNEENYK